MYGYYSMWNVRNNMNQRNIESTQKLTELACKLSVKHKMAACKISVKHKMAACKISVKHKMTVIDEHHIVMDWVGKLLPKPPSLRHPDTLWEEDADQVPMHGWTCYPCPLLSL